MNRLLRHLLFTLLALLSVQAAWAEEELLDPDQAFSLEMSALDANTVRARWVIADGYYLYRNKFKFKSDTAGVTLGEARLPKGKVKQDEFFGEVEIYRGTIEVEIPVERPAGTDTIQITATSQGCADAGVCYPPHRQSREVKLPALLAQAKPLVQPLPGLGAPASIMPFGGAAQDELLDADQAFQASAIALDGQTLQVSWFIAPGYYLYRDKLQFELQDAEGITLGTPVIPQGEEKDDEFFGRIQVFHDNVEVRLPLNRVAGGPTAVTLQLGYQGCAELGVCYPPIKKRIAVDLPAATAATLTDGTEGGAAPTLRWSDVNLDDPDAVLNYLLKSPLTVVIAFSLLLGLLIAFTACMYPMIPIVSSIIVGQGEKMSRGKGFLLTLIYVEAMALTFGIIGGIMGGVGGGVGIQAYFQSPWLLIPFALLFVILALSMFGFYEIQVPSALQSRLSVLSNRQQGGNLAGVGIMGALSALIIGPCGGPMLIAMLAYATAVAAVSKGFIALFAFGNGMGLPLLAVGLLGGELLPRAGTWMNIIKAVAGVILLAVALVFLERMPAIFAPALITFLWAALFIISAIYMGALEPVRESASGWSRLRKGVAVLVLLYGAIFLLASLTGGSGKLTDPLHGSTITGSTVASGTNSAAKSVTTFTKIKTVDELRQQLGEGQPVMLDFYADWCTYCKTYESYVFSDPQVGALLAKFKLLKADITDNDEQDKALLKHTGVFLPPAILFFDRNGNELRALRVVGEMDAGQFKAHLEKVLQNTP